MGGSLLQMDVSGVADMRRTLDLLTADLRKRVVQAALREAAQPIADEARRLAPVGRDEPARTIANLVVDKLREGKAARRVRTVALRARALRDTITVTSQLSQSQRRKRFAAAVASAEFQAYVSATAGHAHLVEFGHALVRYGGSEQVRGRGGRTKTVRTGKRIVGHVPPHPFLRPAFDARRQEALQRFGAALRREIERTVGRLARQAATGRLSRSGRRSVAAAGGVT